MAVDARRWQHVPVLCLVSVLATLAEAVLALDLAGGRAAQDGLRADVQFACAALAGLSQTPIPQRLPGALTGGPSTLTAHMHIALVRKHLGWAAQSGRSGMHSMTMLPLFRIGVPTLVSWVGQVSGGLPL